MHFVLSGGGLKGFALIGFMKALEENNIKPSGISGSSIGIYFCCSDKHWLFLQRTLRFYRAF